MATSNNLSGKKRQACESNIDSDIDTDTDQEVSHDEDCDDSDGNGELNINVDFDAVTPIEPDFHGIKQLLSRLFLMQHVDISELTDLIISQTNVGSTIKVAPDDDDDDVNDDNASDEVYGISSILSLRKHEGKNCMEELKKGILSKCKANVVDKCEALQNIFESKHVGFMVSERFINIPPQFAVPLHRSLKEEVEQAALQDPDFKFDYLLLISKTLQATNDPEGNTKKRNRKEKQNREMNKDEVEYTNVEDKIFHEESELSFSYSVTEETGLAIGGSWDIGGQLMKTYRTVLLIPVTKWKDIVNGIEQLIGI